jgi:signal transduction histidine kinase
VEGRGSVARLIVDDEGPGVPEHEREQIFSRFFRGKGDAVTRTQGAGLGLSIVTEFAASMDGEVAILAAPTGGTRFEVNYPLASRGHRQGEPVTDEGDSHEPA